MAFRGGSLLSTDKLRLLHLDYCRDEQEDGESKELVVALDKRMTRVEFYQHTERNRLNGHES